jgi:lipopolysaccharide transport system ATP-binding protein
VKEQMEKNFGNILLNLIAAPVKNYRKYRSLYKFDDRDDAQTNASDIVWALRDISFSVNEGDVCGIVGANGAGKSTLLKILCRITPPTSGRARITGRISSLLEVGTGFHPELTGRENVYLNGTILGMRKSEVDRKFDEIVDFSGVEKFIDTPVKRYSSGMTVRLAFAVAAHLEPEILLVDEVLAVGDASFQRKCISKMKASAESGRTILFVSHNFAAVENLCTRAILLDKGRMILDGPTKEVLDTYIARIGQRSTVQLENRLDRKGKGEIKAVAVELYDAKGGKIKTAIAGEQLSIRLSYKCLNGRTFRNCRASVAVVRNEMPFFNLSTDFVDTKELRLSDEGYIDFTIPDFPLSSSTYYIHTYIESNKEIQDWVLHASELSVVDGDFYGTGKIYASNKWRGYGVLVKHECHHVRHGVIGSDESFDQKSV